MSKLVEAANRASELYTDFINELNEEDAFALELAYALGYIDLPDEQETPDNEGYGHTTHWDEQTYSNYRYAQDEDGNWLHPYDKEEY